jgi:hypothetical protein
MPTATKRLAAQLDEAYRFVRDRVAGLEEWLAWCVFWTMIDHDLHHGGEIGLLRDLYRERNMTATRPPASGARA